MWCGELAGWGGWRRHRGRKGWAAKSATRRREMNKHAHFISLVDCRLQVCAAAEELSYQTHLNSARENLSWLWSCGRPWQKQAQKSRTLVDDLRLVLLASPLGSGTFVSLRAQIHRRPPYVVLVCARNCRTPNEHRRQAYTPSPLLKPLVN